MVSPVFAVVCSPVHTGCAMQVLPRVATVRGYMQQQWDGFQRL
jgi:hypothetical protein